MSDVNEHPPAFAGHIGRRIRYYRKLREMTQVDLAHKAEINQGFISEIECGRRRPSDKSLQAIAGALNVAEAVLVGSGEEHDSPQPLETRALPMFGEIPVSWSNDSEEDTETYPVLRHLWAPDRYVLRLTFDSMEPTLKPGDLVLVQYRPGVNPEHVQGRICACLYGDQPVLKRVYMEQHGDQRLVLLRGDHPETRPTTVTADAQFSIQGVVTHLVGRDL